MLSPTQAATLHQAVEAIKPAAQIIIDESKAPTAEGKNGYITVYRLLAHIKAQSPGKYIALIFALKELGYCPECLSAVVNMMGS